MSDEGVLPVPVVEATGFHHRSEHGGSKSLVLRVSTGGLALVKFKANPQSTRALVNDYVGTLVGRMAGAPFPCPLLVRVPAEAAVEIAALRTGRWQPGLQFGTVFHPEALPLRNPERVRRLVNLDRLPVTALVETWLHNIDLKPGHLLEVPAAEGPEFLAVDHGHILPHGPGWRRHDLTRHADDFPDIEALTRVAHWARVRFHFSPAVEVCEAVGDAALAAVIASVPREWDLGDDRAQRLQDFLSYRRGRLRSWARRLRRWWKG